MYWTPLQDGQYDEERIALLCGQTISEKISIKRTLFLHQWCSLYRDSTVLVKYYSIALKQHLLLECQSYVKLTLME